MFVDKNKYNIIVIEDNLGDFFLLQEYLSEKIINPSIKHFEKFNHFLEFKDQINTFDIIFLDLSLPDKSGSELVQEVLKLASNIPVVVLTGYSDFSFAMKAIALGASDYLLKDELNSITLYKSIVYNIERFKNISKILESEQLYNDLFELSPQPIFVIDATSHRILDTNQASENLYQFNKEEILNKHFNTIFKDEEKIFDPTQNTNILTHTLKNNKTIITEVKFNKIIHNNNEAIIIVTNDITKSIEHLKEIENHNEKLKDIAWIQSHVIRAPLTNIIGLIKIIKDTNAVTDKELLSYLAQSVEELENSINTIVEKTHN